MKVTLVPSVMLMNKFVLGEVRGECLQNET